MKKIAEKLNTTPALITYYEKGNVSVSIDKLQQIAEILNGSAATRRRGI